MLTIGYIFSAKKLKELAIDKLIALGEANNVKFIELHLDKPIEEQLEGLTIDCLVHKTISDISLEYYDADARQHVLALETFCIKFKEATVTLFPTDVIRKLVDRRRMMAEVLDVVSNPDTTTDAHAKFVLGKCVMPLPWLVTSPHEIQENVCLSSIGSSDGSCASSPHELASSPPFRAPYVVKSCIACGPSFAHDVTICSDPSIIPPNSMVQPFIHHGSVVFKVYVLGTKYWMHSRDSVGDTSSSFKFNAAHQKEITSHVLSGDIVEDGKLPCGCAGDTSVQSKEVDAARNVVTVHSIPMPARQLLSVVSQRLTDVMVWNVLERHHDQGCDLFGYDMLYDIQTKKYVIIDVNYFPGYHGVASFHEEFVQYMINKIASHKKQL